jgi:hypothetical protein
VRKTKEKKFTHLSRPLKKSIARRQITAVSKKAYKKPTKGAAKVSNASMSGG